MKKNLLFVLLLAVLPFACNKENENPASELEKVNFQLLSEEDLISLPPALLSSDNNYATMVVNQVNWAQAFKNTFAAYYDVPNGATKSNTPIVASNARMAETTYLVYTWSYFGMSWAYQIHATSNKYVLEILFKEGTGPWMLMMYAEQTKDGKKGEMRFYDYDGTGEVYWTFAWETVGDLYKFSMFDNAGSKYYLEASLTTGAGKMEFYNTNKLYLRVTWTATGSGTWTAFENGSTTGSGTW